MEHTTKQRHLSIAWIIGGALLLLLLTFLNWNSALAAPIKDAPLGDSDIEVYGRIDSFPASLIGTWVVDGIIYEADDNSQYKQEAGSFAVDTCVKVAYLPDTSPFTIRQIETENDSDCDGGMAGTPEATETPDPSSTPDETETPDPSSTPDETETPDPSSTPTPDSTPDAGDEMKVRGIVEVLPSPGLTGTWVISGVAYLADGSTEFEQSDGPFGVGACVEVEIRPSTNPLAIDEIETEEIDDCQAGTTSEATPTPEGEREIYGRIDSLPTGLIGDWVINGTTYTADSNTEFDPEHGPFANLICVKVHIVATITPPVMREIETEHDYRCGNVDTPQGTPEAEMFGTIQNFPAGLIGTWNIGGMSFITDNATEFDQENGPYGVDSTVKVHFVTQSDGAHYAREIETKFRTDSNDDDNDGQFKGAEGHAYGAIDELPAGLIGKWTVGGIVYTTTDQTRFEEDHTGFAVGVRLKVQFVAQNGVRVARKIETTSDDGEVSDAEHARLFGFVRQMPASGFVGSWTIDDSKFVADKTSRFKEDHGLLGLGAFVSVEYSMVDGQPVIHELETHVPPGAGSDDAIGRIRDSSDLLNAAALQPGVWTVGEVTYVVSAATNLNDAAGALEVGALVTVNSYVDSNGGHVATQIRSIADDEQLFLPVITR